MSFADLLRYATGALSGHGLRTALSMLGVAIGVASVVLLTALGVGARDYVSNQFASLGTDLLIVVPGHTETTGGIPGMGGAPRDLTLDDARAVLRGVRGVRQATPVSMGNEAVSFGDRSRDVAVVGTSAEYAEIRNLRIAAGQFLPSGEWDRGAQVAVLGHDLADELFVARDPVGEVIRIGEFRMRVIGVLAELGVNLGVNMDEVVMVPVATNMRMFDRTSLFRVLLKVAPGADLAAVQEDVTAVLMDRHADDQDFTLITQDALAASFGAIFNALTAAIAGIAAISLSVAGIGIMNVMLVSVSERTAEIGLLKAVGAGSRQILAAFLLEAVLLSLAGGLAGLAVGWIGLETVTTLYPDFPVRPPVWAVAAALGLSLVIGALFGVLPARRATRLDPVAALHG